MSNNGFKPDLPLRLALYLLRVFLTSPAGSIFLKLGYKYYQPEQSQWVAITRLKLELPRLALPFASYRLVQISDFHIGTWADRSRLSEAVRLVNALHPDLVAITGDFVTFDPEKYADDLVYILRNLKAHDGCVAVLGNHDHWSDPVVVRRILQRAGVIELNNRVLTLQRGGSWLHIGGVDDIMEELDDLPAVLAQIPPGGAAILLAHEPDFGEISAASGRFDLQLSGHTHGGQVHFPRLGPLVLPRLGRKYPSGLFEINGMHLYTNRGLGTAELEFRYNCPAEITLFELYPRDQTGQPELDSF